MVWSVRVHTQNTMLCCMGHRSIHKKIYGTSACNALPLRHLRNQAVHSSSWCMSLDTLFHCKRYLTGLSRWRSTHEWDRCAVQLSRSTFLTRHRCSIRPVLTLKTYSTKILILWSDTSHWEFVDNVPDPDPDADYTASVISYIVGHKNMPLEDWCKLWDKTAECSGGGYRGQ